MTEALLPIVEMRNIAVSFDEKVILDDLTFLIHPRDRFVVMGKSGGGKSTILRLIVGSLKPDRGSVCFKGEEINRLRRSNLNNLRTKIGMVYQQSALISSMTVEENLALPLEELSRKNRTEIDKIIDETLEVVGMRDAKKLMPAELSGGMRKRIGVARALVLKPELILFDEPSAGLDPTTSAHLVELIVSLTETTKCTSVVVTHEMETAFRIATRIALLHEGKIVEESTPEKFRNSLNPTVHQFLVPEATAVSEKRKYAN